jgi:hypothetical protein
LYFVLFAIISLLGGVYVKTVHYPHWLYFTVGIRTALSIVLFIVFV